MDFLMGGDPKFMIANTLLFIMVIVLVVKRRGAGESSVIDKLNKQLSHLSFTIIMLSVLSLLLGLLHSFYFIGAATGIAHELLFNGLSRTLISPTYGLILFTVSKLLMAFSVPKPTLAKA
ncbi:MAG: hypothetical protein Roseis2KO_45330 [Roseivirga sp.]